MERTSGGEYFNETIVSKRTPLWKSHQRLQEKRDRVRGAIRTEQTADNPLIDGVAYLVTHC